MRYKTTTSTNLLFDYYNMIDSFKHRLTVHGNIENTLWSSEPFSWWQNMGILALGDFSQKGFYARCCDAGIGWQSNLGLFFLIWLALELARGRGGGVLSMIQQQYGRNVFECYSNNKCGSIVLRQPILALWS